jgi:hypothetical protein
MIHHATAVSEAYRQVLIQKAGVIAHKYPQYAGKFNDNLLVRFNMDVESFHDGDFSLAEPHLVEFKNNEERVQYIPVWDFKRQNAVYVPYLAVDFIERNVKLNLSLEY